MQDETAKSGRLQWKRPVGVPRHNRPLDPPCAVCLATLIVAVVAACGGGGQEDERDGRLEVTARFLSEDEEVSRVGIAGLRMCASNPEGEGRCVDVPLPEGDVVVSLNVRPGDDWKVRMWAFNGRGEGVWAGRAFMRAFPGESTRSTILLSRAFDLTRVPCAPGLQTTACGMHTPRAFHSITPLPGGKILISGGFSSVRTDTTCDPECARPDSSGQGGFVDDSEEPCVPLCRLLLADDTAEVYDPIEGRVTKVFDLSRGRAMHTATPTSDGRHVILAGGLSSARLYLDGQAPLMMPDSFPSSDTGKATAEVIHAFLASRVREIALSGPRFMHDAVDDGLGRVVLIGGMTVEEGSVRFVGGEDRVPPRLELVAPEGAGSVPVTGATARRGHRALRLDELIIVVGGNDVSSTQSGHFAEVHDLDLGVTSSLGDPDQARPRQRRYAPMWHSLNLLSGGLLIALGGHYDDAFVDDQGLPLPPLTPLPYGLLLDLDSPGVEGALVHMIAPRSLHAATVLEDGRVLVSGGLTRADGLRVTRSVERLDPEHLGSEALVRHDDRPLQLAGARMGHSAVLLADGTVLRAGGLSTIDPERMDESLPCSVIACDLDVFNPTERELDPPVAESLLD